MTMAIVQHACRSLVIYLMCFVKNTYFDLPT